MFQPENIGKIEFTIGIFPSSDRRSPTGAENLLFLVKSKKIVDYLMGFQLEICFLEKSLFEFWNSFDMLMTFLWKFSSFIWFLLIFCTIGNNNILQNFFLWRFSLFQPTLTYFEAGSKKIHVTKLNFSPGGDDYDLRTRWSSKICMHLDPLSFLSLSNSKTHLRADSYFQSIHYWHEIGFCSKEFCSRLFE